MNRKGEGGGVDGGFERKRDGEREKPGESCSSHTRDREAAHVSRDGASESTPILRSLKGRESEHNKHAGKSATVVKVGDEGKREEEGAKEGRQCGGNNGVR